MPRHTTQGSNSDRFIGSYRDKNGTLIYYNINLRGVRKMQVFTTEPTQEEIDEAVKKLPPPDQY